MKKSEFYLPFMLWYAFIQIDGAIGNWEEWWTYDGISGPDFWGLLNPEWSLCTKGRRQSPVDLDPEQILFDPYLRPLNISSHRVSGVLTNTGHSVAFRVSNPQTSVPINISGGPLSYKYRFHELHLHYGRTDDRGSEHTVSGTSFPGELQIYGYNSDLFSNFSEALALCRSDSIVAIAVLIQIGNLSNDELRILSSQLSQIVYRGQEVPLHHVSVQGLLPSTSHFVTYEGSLTVPACHESVTWLVINRPIYITKQQLYILRKLMQGDERNPKAPLGNNFRPPLPLNRRALRSNINFIRQDGKECPNMHRNMRYQANTWTPPAP
ncbi:unnamed protein product, partial [Larinioides sclopetarius]